MQAQTHIKKPSNWQDFEKLCKKLWGRIWDCDYIKLNGCLGQNQHGIDILGRKKDEALYSAIQCKCKDENKKSKLTQKEIDTEINNALHHKDEIQRLIIATTASKDAKIEEYVRKKDIANRQKGLFEIQLFAWEDIEDLLKEHRDIYQWYVSNSDFIDLHQVSITYEDGRNEYTIHPHYIKKKKRYVLPDDKQYLAQKQAEQNMRKVVDKLCPPKLQPLVHSQESKIDKTWCYIPVCIKNTGTSAINLVKIEINCQQDGAVIFYHKIPSELDGVVGTWGAPPPELVETSGYQGLIYQPRTQLIVSQDKQHIQFYVRPHPLSRQLSISFEIYAKECHDTKVLQVLIEPEYHRGTTEYIVVNTTEEIKQDCIEYTPYFEYD